VIDIEKSSFHPLVSTTTGGMAPECNRAKKRLAENIAEKHRITLNGGPEGRISK